MVDYEKHKGKVFGRLTIITAFKNEKGETKCLCQCTCGRKTEVYLSNLKAGHTKSCGCGEEENRRKFRDITGQQFGHLVALRPSDKRQNGCVVWECVCTCGNHCEKTGRNLLRGISTHCGCARKTNQNRYYRDLRNQRFNRLLVRYPTKQRSGNGSVIWNCICDCNTEIEVSENDLIHGNRVSCGCKARENGKALTNYLHFVDGTCVEFLTRKKRSDNSSGYPGVYDLKNGSYRAGITFKGKRYNLGKYDTFDEAKHVRLQAEQELHQSFLNGFYAEAAQ